MAEKEKLTEERKQDSEELTLEESFQKLDEMLLALESRNISLEESFATYQKGMELLKSCNEKIDRVEKKMLILNEEGEADEF
ncbi:exodeoxyribonuclease VII small subunit [Murimonas intestini]|uniref:Exodeoxyribonuclease 7 small subunit n=1 Tax=Murimonas intestini TaxID=1337051 RepID=A0AB73T783_9FIRM|nr:exodeoxyribonuclease VII small subunit [Murimonas intestini]MCR1841260.1 exodeoxyribonuclease VII small subunit [Murimonas intestini]MCR1866178.1 exodeoxyribonuclease VII small subunit [Murimonas intestini]MCR1882705.1 exodeoxyribonuclease VII small subunit [Murimonas intestini]